MPHRTVDPQAFKDIETEIASYLEAVRSADQYLKDSESENFKSLLKSFKSLIQALRLRKDNSLKQCTDEGAKAALYMLGKENQLQEIIESFEDADKWKKYYQDKIDELERNREELKSIALS